MTTPGAPSTLIIRMPTPTNTYSTQWANSLVSSIELQNRTINLAQNTSSVTTEDNAEAVSWFNG
mgnify:CR=1 FL=1|tara:strand:+ start:95 stop:286 length:192 start_codon:yes stop_codon:yes gene_type:complete